MHMAETIATAIHARDGGANVAQGAGASIPGCVVGAVTAGRTGGLGTETITHGAILGIVGIDTASGIQMILRVHDKSAAQHDATEQKVPLRAVTIVGNAAKQGFRVVQLAVVDVGPDTGENSRAG